MKEYPCPSCSGPRDRGSTLCIHCYQTRAHQKYADLADLIEHGETPAAACQRIGVTPEAASRWYYRNNLYDLARLFHATTSRGIHK